MHSPKICHTLNPQSLVIFIHVVNLCPSFTQRLCSRSHHYLPLISFTRLLVVSITRVLLLFNTHLLFVFAIVVSHIVVSFYLQSWTLFSYHPYFIIHNLSKSLSTFYFNQRTVFLPSLNIHLLLVSQDTQRFLQHPVFLAILFSSSLTMVVSLIITFIFHTASTLALYSNCQTTHA